jgi:hypothetical protein
MQKERREVLSAANEIGGRTDDTLFRMHGVRKTLAAFGLSSPIALRSVATRKKK